MMIVSNGRRLSIACSSSHIRTRCRPLALPTSPRTSYVSSQATQSDLLLLLSHPERPLAAPKPPRRSYDSLKPARKPLVPPTQPGASSVSSETHTDRFLTLAKPPRHSSGSSEATVTVVWLIQSETDRLLFLPKPLTIPDCQ